MTDSLKRWLVAFAFLLGACGFLFYAHGAMNKEGIFWPQWLVFLVFAVVFIGFLRGLVEISVEEKKRFWPYGLLLLAIIAVILWAWGRGADSWGVRDLLHLTPAERAELHKSFHEKPALRAPATASALTPQDAVTQTDAITAQTSVAMHKRGKGPLERMVNARAIQVPATDEVERLRRLEEMQLFLLSELDERIQQGAKNGGGCVSFTRSIANSRPGRALSLEPLSFKECVDLAMAAEVPVRHFRYPDGRVIVEAPTLALEGSLGYSMNYDVGKGWHIIWTGKFRKLASKPN